MRQQSPELLLREEAADERRIESLRTKCLASLWQNTGQIQVHLQRHPSVPRQSAVAPSPPPSRLLTHHPPGLTWLCYMKITFLHLKSQRSHASVTHRTPSRHISVLLNNVLQFPSAFWWMNKCYTSFYHNFVFAVCLKVIYLIVYALF